MSRDNAARTTGRELKQSNICQSVDASGLTGTCDRTIRPTSVDELRTALLEAAAIQQRVTVRGAGTGLSGGAVPDGGLLVSLDRLEKKIVIDPQEMQVEVSASVTIAEIEEATRQIGLFYPPDPTEPAASIGGTIATNASGARTFRYGPTARWVDALTLLLVDGDEISLRRREVIASEGSMLLTTKNGREIDVPIPVRPDIDVTKNTAGYQLDDALDAIDLVVGSDGTLGIITSATLRLLERPEKTLSLLIFFSLFISQANYNRSLRVVHVFQLG